MEDENSVSTGAAEAVADNATTETISADTVSGADTVASDTGTESTVEGGDSVAGDTVAAVTAETFTMPEGVELDVELVAEFLPLAAEYNLNQGQSQKLVDIYTKGVEKAFQAGMAGVDAAKIFADGDTARANKWADEAKADKEIGGKALEQNLSIANDVLSKFAPDTFVKDLNESGFGNNPRFIQMLTKVHGALGLADDRHIAGGANGNVTNKTEADIFYGNN